MSWARPGQGGEGREKGSLLEVSSQQMMTEQEEGEKGEHLQPPVSAVGRDRAVSSI